MPNIRIVQWDLQAPKIEESGDTIAYYDGFKDYDVRPTTFHTSRIAPDGKIYVTCGSTVRQFHVIHKPNRKGAACMMKQHDFQLKARNSATLPNHPNYRLGPIDGSPCDTLGIDNIPVALYRYDKDSANLYQVEFTDLSHYEPAKWEWDFGDGTPKSNTQEPIHIFPKKGEFQVCLTVSNPSGKHTYCRKIGIGINATEVEEVEKMENNLFRIQILREVF